MSATCIMMLVVSAAALRTPGRAPRMAVQTAAKPRTKFAAPDCKFAPKPGIAENALFVCDESVAFWADFQRSGPKEAVDNLREAFTVAAKHASSGPQAASYWAKHSARTGYFIANALSGTAAFELSQALNKDVSTSGPAAMGFGNSRGGMMMGIDGGVASRIILEAILTYEQDWRHVSAKKYKPPWDMTAGHRQSTPAYALRQSQRFLAEAVNTLGKKERMEEPGVWLDAPDQLYPPYFMNDFHYQTDGWMSAKSAAVYETSTETLFLGRQDAMQRHTLLPLQNLKGRNGKPPKILEVACGTGRFATFVRDNHPTAELTCVDLSPFYLAAARENDQYWTRTQARRSRAPAGFGFGRRSSASDSGASSRPAAARMVQANAEALPFDAGEFDAVVCVYLFHEMPKEAQDAAAAEMARVLAPGGVLSFTDSIQRGDRPALDDQLGNFEALNEPHYINYIQRDLGELFSSLGLSRGAKYVASTSKTLSFTKPIETGGAGDAADEVDFGEQLWDPDAEDWA